MLSAASSNADVRRSLTDRSVASAVRSSGVRYMNAASTVWGRSSSAWNKAAVVSSSRCCIASSKWRAGSAAASARTVPPTLAYPLAYFLETEADTCPCAAPEQLRVNTVPPPGATVRPAAPLSLLRQALHLPPGRRLAVRPAAAPATETQHWEVFTDAYNARYLRCERTGAVELGHPTGSLEAAGAPTYSASSRSTAAISRCSTSGTPILRMMSAKNP